MKPKDLPTITRSWSLSITFIAVTVGTALAASENAISCLFYTLCLGGAFAAHAGANVLNDYFDLTNKVDTPQAPTALYRRHPVFAHIATPHELLTLSVILLGFSALTGTTLASLKNPILIPLLAAGLFIAIFYTAGRSPLKYRALGEIAAGTAFGPLMVEGAYAVQTSHLSLRTLAVSLPIGIFVAAILLANNLRDAAFDRVTGVRTLSHVLGPAKAFRLYADLLILPYILVVLCILLRLLTWSSLLVFVAFPLTAKVIRQFSKDIPQAADGITSKILFLFGSALILSIIMGNSL